MSLTPGTRLGPYEVTALLGEGGMGKVWRAHHTGLKRDDALKVLPDAFASDPERLARFRREAQVLASLNHPNIAHVYGLEQADGVQALVMELVEGPTLADRIARGPIPVDEALPIAKQIADALETAHEQGIIHRDLKPANIKLRLDGTVKVLDFGLAKALDSAPAIDASQSPTITSPVMLSGVGVILGTAAYMSPEQTHGKAVDKRTDIWAFGCVFYEMLTGRRAFQGDTVAQVMAKILERDPDFARLPDRLSPQLVRLLRRCLDKDPHRRLRDIGELRFELEQRETPQADVAAPLVARSRLVQRRLTLAAMVIGLMAATGLAVWAVTRPTPPRVTRTTIVPSAAAPLFISPRRNIAIAPDGRRIAYAGANGTQLLVRTLDQLMPTSISGLGLAQDPLFSPDGQWIAFFDGNAALGKVAVTGGPPVILARTGAAGYGLSWASNDTIVFATNDPSTGLLRVPAAGGEPEVLTKPDRAQGEFEHLLPEVLPGGQAVLFTIIADGDQTHTAILDLRTGERRILLRGGSHAQYVAPGYLVYGVASTLHAVAFDVAHLNVTGSPVPVVEGVLTLVATIYAHVASDGTLIYVPGNALTAPRRTLAWVDRQGREETLAAPPRTYRYARISPDGMRIAVEVQEPGGDIWIWNMTGQTLTRFTFDPAQDLYPVWTPNGRRVAFRSQRGGPANVYWQSADGTGEVERLTDTASEQAPYAFTADGMRLVLRQDGPKSGGDIMLLSLDGNRQLTPLIQTPFNERNAEISPDGRWIAYESDESGREEIYVRPFPDINNGRWQVSSGGGSEPLWARNGRELFYRSPDDAVMGVAVESSAGFSSGRPVKLVEAGYYAGAASGAAPGRTYDVSPDGRRFLMVKESVTDQSGAPPAIVVVQNWVEELKRLVPTN